MLLDKTTKISYSSGTAAKRELGVLTFNRKVKNKELVYIEVTE